MPDEILGNTGTIMHSDQGSQYCSQAFQNCIRAAQMRTSCQEAFKNSTDKASVVSTGGILK